MTEYEYPGIYNETNAVNSDYKTLYLKQFGGKRVYGTFDRNVVATKNRGSESSHKTVELSNELGDIC